LNSHIHIVDLRATDFIDDATRESFIIGMKDEIKRAVRPLSLEFKGVKFEKSKIRDNVDLKIGF
jgi:hypothetical protein